MSAKDNSARPLVSVVPPATKNGILVLLDALGTRTATISEARSYLSSLAALQEDIGVSLEINLSKHPKETLEFFKHLSVHFFGDSVLMIYDTVEGQPLYTYIDYLSNILGYLYIAALENGILFRGAISIGEYLQEDKVVLGPAVTDAAAWYDKFDFIGVAATPFATRRLQNAYYQKHPAFDEPWAVKALSMFLYPVPLTRGGAETLFAINWPATIGYNSGIEPSDRNFLKLYHDLTHRFPIPFGTESKFTNTESFVKVGSAMWKNTAP